MNINLPDGVRDATRAAVRRDREMREGRLRRKAPQTMAVCEGAVRARRTAKTSEDWEKEKVRKRERNSR